MKNISYLLFCFIIVSCGIQKIDTNYFPYNEGVSFKVGSTANLKMVEGFPNTTYIATKGTRFKAMTLRFQNDTSQEQIIDFEEFYLLDNNNNKYYVEYAGQVGKITTSVKKMEHTLKAGTNKQFSLTFMPPFPKDQDVTRILVKDSIVSF